MFSTEDLKLILDIMEDYSDDNFPNVNNLKERIAVLIEMQEFQINANKTRNELQEKYQKLMNKEEN